MFYSCSLFCHYLKLHLSLLLPWMLYLLLIRLWKFLCRLIKIKRYGCIFIFRNKIEYLEFWYYLLHFQAHILKIVIFCFASKQKILGRNRNSDKGLFTRLVVLVASSIIFISVFSFLKKRFSAAYPLP